MKLDFKTKTTELLKGNPDKKFTAREIGEWIFDNYEDECRELQKRSKAKRYPLTDDKALKQQLVRNICSLRPSLLKQHPKIKTTDGRPIKYYFTESSDSEEINNAEINETSRISKENEPAFKEHHLYQPLSNYLWSEFKIYPKRIDENRSKNSHGAGGNKWLHTDLVGMEDLSHDLMGQWCDEIKNCVKQYPSKRTNLWSFEVKVKINRSNVRESFFQAVSNSSWANFGYLVANEINSNASKELRILSSSHGIGVILLDAENPLESQIIIPARERNDIDWNTANRLAEQNPDFRRYIENVRAFCEGSVEDMDNTFWDITDDDN